MLVRRDLRQPPPVAGQCLRARPRRCERVPRREPGGTPINRTRIAAALAVAAAVTIPPATAPSGAHTSQPIHATAAVDAARPWIPVLRLPAPSGLAADRPAAPPVAAQPGPDQPVAVAPTLHRRLAHTTPTGHRARPARAVRARPRLVAVTWIAPTGAGGGSVVVRAALRQVGDPYRWGAAGPDAWDCSGLVMGAFAQAGIRLPHQSELIARMGRPVPRDQWQPGTVITYPGHVALYVGGNLMVEAPHPGARVRVVPVRPGQGRWLFTG
jgi:cell wall-associated NlpC family hydrolase